MHLLTSLNLSSPAKWIFFFFFSYMAYWIRATAATYPAAVVTSDPFTNCARPGIEPMLHSNPRFFFFFFFFFFFGFLGPHPWYMEIPRIRVELELQLLAYTIATATLDPSCFCDLRHSSQQHQILNPLSKTRDQSCILMATCQISLPMSHDGNSYVKLLCEFSYLLL